MTVKAGPTPRGVRRCRWLMSDGTRCDDRFTAGPTEQVVALCPSHGAKACPRGTRNEMVAEYVRLLSLYGWKSA